MPTAIQNNTGTLSIGKQSAKGTPNLVSTYRLRYTGGFGPGPADQIIDLVESDSSALASQQAKVGYTVTGTSSHFVREDEFGLLAYLIMGANADSGAVNFTHTATHSLTPPYVTLIRNVNGTTLSESHSDARVSSATISGGVGAALGVDLTWGALATVFNTTNPAVAATATTPLTYPTVTVTLAASAPGTVESFSLTINNNAAFFQADTGMSAVDYIPGRKVVTGNMVLLFENDQQYRLFHTGSTSGTAPSATLMPAQSLVILASKGTNNQVSFNMTNIRYSALEPQLGTDGAPIRQSIDFASANLGTTADYLSIVTKNQVATY